MTFNFHYVFIIFYLVLSGSFVYSTLTDTLRSIFNTDQTDNKEDGAALKDTNLALLAENAEENINAANDIKTEMKKTNPKSKKHELEDDVFNELSVAEIRNDVLEAKNKSSLLRRLKDMQHELSWESGNKLYRASADDTKDHRGLNNEYSIDPVLNLIKTNSQRKNLRRSRKLRNKRKREQRMRKGFEQRALDDSSSSSTSSSSQEMKDFKTEFKEMWLHKKFEALNQTAPRGDQVNMVAARPWGVQCGDPNQHDMPWGTCMLTIECEPEFRIYRGDFFCGRTQFICCALQLTNYDMYQGFDVSFDDKSLSTDSEEKRAVKKSSTEKKKRRKAKERKKRKKDRDARKKKIKHHIKKIIKEMSQILNRQYRNGTRNRKKRTKQLKKFIKDLKKQYKKDRQSVKDLHEEEMIKIDNELLKRLFEIKYVNEDFVKNATFRQILINGTISKKGARMLVEAYPELNEFLETRRGGDVVAGRRHGGDDYLEYDIEYGYLYY